jgi:general secretion pathway protein G
VLAILGIVLYALVKPRIGHNYQSPSHAAWPDTDGSIKSALGAYEVDNGSYPKSLQDLLQQPSGATKWHGPYFDPPKLPNDPWGHQYFYEFLGKHNTTGYDLFSAGPDGKTGTGDDIGNWMN